MLSKYSLTFHSIADHTSDETVLLNTVLVVTIYSVIIIQITTNAKRCTIHGKTMVGSTTTSGENAMNAPIVLSVNHYSNFKGIPSSVLFSKLRTAASAVLTIITVIVSG